MNTSRQLLDLLEARRLLSTATLVDFGDAAANNVYGTAWVMPIYGQYTSYSADGPDGIVGSSTGAYFAAGVSGTPQTFAVGDQIKVTWYNRSAAAVNGYTPRISFNDPDQSNGGVSGTWLNMDTINVPAGQSATATYTVDATWAGARSLINAHRNVNGTGLLLDKIEWVTASNSALSVHNGSGDGSYAAGTVVNIAADAAPQGYQFDRWTGDTASLANPTSTSTTYTMPGTAASVVATYIPAGGVVVSTVSGSVTHGSTLTITGARFGAKAQAAPLKRDDFESGAAGQIVTNGWYTDATKPVYSTAQPRVPGRANQSAFLDFRTNYGSLLGLVNLGLGHGDKLYLSGWYYQVTAGAPSRNFKFLAVRGGNTGGLEDPEIRVDQYPNTNSGHAYIAGSTGATIIDTWSVGGQLFTGAWHRAEAFIDFGQAGQNNGEFSGWLDGTPWWSLRNFNFDLTGDTFNNLYFSHFFSRDTGTPTPQLMQFWDELYVDTTRARVEIGNAPTWEACTQREVQTPTSWTDGAIDITVNAGAFANGPAYLYVIDANGNVNPQGYALSVGQTSVANRPPAVDAGPDQRSTLGASVSLDGTAADDAHPGSLTYAWSQVGGPGTVTFGNAALSDTTASFSAVGEYLLKLTVSDGNQSRDDVVKVLVTDAVNRVPVVNLGGSAGANTFGFLNWNQLYLGNYVGYSSNGPAGTKGGSTGVYDVVSVSGANHTYAVGEKIVATWYNDGASAITFTPKVSFDDPDMNGSGTAGTWFNMSSVTIPAYGTATTSYTIDAATSGTRALLNICRFTNNTGAALLDRIEIEYVAPAALVTVAATDAAAGEPANPGTFTITRSGSTAAALIVNYTLSGTATNGIDYTTLTGSVTIPIGQSSANIVVSAIDDVAIENAETVILTLITGAGYTISTPSTATVTLADNDTPQLGVTGVSGILNHRQPITISGNLFGAGPTDIVFDDFEDGVVGTPVLSGPGSAVVGNWDSTAGVITYSDVDSVSGSKASLSDMSGSYTNKVVRNFAPGTNEVYASWWVRIPEIIPGEGNVDGLNWKHVWLLGSSTADDDILMVFLGADASVLVSGNAGPANTYTSWSLGDEFDRGDWVRMSFYVKGGTTDGAYQLTMSNPRTGARSSFTMAAGRTWGGATSTAPYQYESINFNGYGRQTTGSLPMFDDTYSASGPNSRARVEIGNAPVYANCTNLSVCGVTDWTAGSIDAQLNFGSLDTGGPLYLFVIDASGNASPGYALSVSQAPTAYDDQYTVATGGTLTVGAPGAIANDIDLQGQAITATKVTNPAHGTVVFNSNGSFTYTPAAGYYGADSFTYRVSDGTNTGNVATVNLSVRQKLVDYGDQAANNTFGTPWTTVLKGPYVGYSGAGPAGLGGGSTGATAYQGISGAARTFMAGETVFVTWYNNDSTAASFTPKISFDDPDAVGSGTAGTWYDMTPVIVGPGKSFTSSYTLAAGGTFSRINVARVANNLGNVFCDRIELGSLADLTGGTGGVGEEPPLQSSVAGRYTFYNNSAFDGQNTAANAADDGAIATDKQALLPGQTAGFANYTSYSRGINGVTIDVLNLPIGTVPTAEDFTFRVGNTIVSDSWPPAPAPLSISVRRGAGAGGSDRITLVWADNAIQKQWLEVTLKATPRTGLNTPDVFYFGNAIGETGNGNDMVVNASDVSLLVNRYSGRSTVGVTNAYDINRDGVVNASDTSIVVNHYSGRSPAVRITAPSPFSQASIAGKGQSTWGRWFGNEATSDLLH